MSDEVDNLKKLIGDTQKELSTTGSCFWFFHRWSRWMGSVEYQTRYCLNCSKQEEIDKRCKHEWKQEQKYNISEGKIITAIENIYCCSKCFKHKKVKNPVEGKVSVEYY